MLLTDDSRKRDPFLFGLRACKERRVFLGFLENSSHSESTLVTKCTEHLESGSGCHGPKSDGIHPTPSPAGTAGELCFPWDFWLLPYKKVASKELPMGPQGPG